MLRNVFNYITYAPKKLISVLMITLLVATPLVVSAGWWPDRPVKDYNNPVDRLGFDHPVFNSFINTPFYGDERAFFDSRHASATASGSYGDVTNGVQPGEEL